MITRRNTMNNKKRNPKTQKQNFPFASEIKMMKADFKNKIDKMSDEEFIDFISFLMFSSEAFDDEEWTLDEEWEDEAEEFYSKKDNKSNNIVQFNNDDLPF
jgi:hypothetical protein